MNNTCISRDLKCIVCVNSDRIISDGPSLHN